ncbi:MAG: protease modulator HflC [Gammaproteobacteria bacterium]|jgi:membrane protease subunit HflC|nr:protease modulator HflC [Gammaproteobacteria bacterium]
MNPNKAVIPLIALLLAGFGLYAATFYVHQWEVALKLRLGEIVSSDYQPGIHFLVPVLNEVRKFDGRIQGLDTKPERFLTIEKKDVLVDSYVKWRISNVAQYFRATGGNAARAERLLSERINTRLRDEFGRRTIQEVVSGERGEIMQALTKAADEQAAELGIEIIDVRVKKIDLPGEVSESVYDRMRAERERVARDLRAKGAEAAERIRADADRQQTEILATAYRESEVTRGEGDAKAAEIYAGAFQKNAEFYSFWRSLGAYRAVFERGGDLMVLDPASEFFRYLSSPTGKR